MTEQEREIRKTTYEDHFPESNPQVCKPDVDPCTDCNCSKAFGLPCDC